MSIGVLSRPRKVLFIAVLVIGTAIYGTTRVQVDNNSISYLQPGSPVVVATEKLNTHAAGSLSLNLLIRSTGDTPEPFKDPDRLKALADLSGFLDDHPIVGKTLGLSKLIERINRVLHDGEASFERVPGRVEYAASSAGGTDAPDTVPVPGREMIAQYLLLYENSGGDTLSDVVDVEYRQAHVTVILNTNSSRKILALIREIQTYEKVYFPEDLKIDFSGSANVTVASTFEIVSGQIVSLLMSFLLIFGLLIGTFRSLFLGLLAMIPLAATVLVNFGIMGFFGIPLDIGTAVVSSIVIGIGVDYSIHYLKRWQESIRNEKSFQQAVLYTVRHSGKAIVANAFTVGTGFAALLFSVFSPLRTMGWMIMMTMFVSALATIVLLPTCLYLLQAGLSARKVSSPAKWEGEHIA